MKDQSPTTKYILQKANMIYRVYIATEDGFPEAGTTDAKIRGCYRKACADLEPELAEWKTKNQGIIKRVVSA